MRLLCFGILCAALCASGSAAAGDGPDAAGNPTSSAIERQLEQLRALVEMQSRELADQRQRLAAMEEEVRRMRSSASAVATHAAPSPAFTVTPAALPPAVADMTPLPTAPPVAPPAASPAPQSQNTDVLWRQLSERIDRIGPFSFSGDVRLRSEPFLGGPANSSLVRNRMRIRLRFNANARLNEEIRGGFSIASGDMNDPISTNQDLNQFYSRKAFQLDRAFVTYTPQWFRPLTLTGGKFAYPWYRTELTWDNDLNPEGVAQTLNFDLESTPVLKRVALVGFQLPFAETTGINFNHPAGDPDRSVLQSVVYGGQLQTEWQLAPRLRFAAYAAFYNFHKADSIAFSLATANPASPANGALALKGSSVQNSITVWTQSTLVPTTEPGVDAEVDSRVVNAQFASKFALLDTIARFDITTGSPRWPVVLLGDFVQNTRACANVDDFFVPEPPPGAAVTASTNAPCDPSARRAYWLEARFGRASERGDLQFAYTRMFVEREAVLGAFNFSDFRQASNVSQHRVEAFYNLYRNFQLGFTGLFGRPLNFDSTTPPENLLKRLQFDAVYRF